MANYDTAATAYTRTVIYNKLTDIIAGAPNALNALKELSATLGTDANLSATVLNKINSKSNQFTVSSPLLLDLNPGNPDLLNTSASVHSNTEPKKMLRAKAIATSVYTKTEANSLL